MLDYTIELATDRVEFVRNLDLTEASQYELEKVANYILYGKTPKGNALPEAKEIPRSKSSYTKPKPQSLESLVENPYFDEGEISNEIVRPLYLNPKPTISRKRDAEIPTMKQLWEAIDAVEQKKEESENSLEKYLLRHLAISLRKEQYYLKDLFVKPIHFIMPVRTSPHETEWDTDCGFPVEPLELRWRKRKGKPDVLEYCGEEEWTWREIAKHNIDLTDPHHIYCLLEHYSAIYQQYSEAHPLAHILCVFRALETIVDRTPLTPVRKYILIRKVDGTLNEQIVAELREKFEVGYGKNYISTIWVQEICGKIAETAKLMEDEQKHKNNPKKWKVCRSCKKSKLRDYREFSRKSGTPDGLDVVCQVCKANNKEGLGGKKTKNNRKKLH